MSNKTETVQFYSFLRKKREFPCDSNNDINITIKFHEHLT